MSDIKSQVNTYLYTAQALASQAEASDKSGLGKAAIVGASVSLVQAWWAWLDELAGYLKVQASILEDESSAVAKALPDCQLLLALKNEPGSWYQQVSALVDNPLAFYEKELSKVRDQSQIVDSSRVNIIASARANREREQKSLVEVLAELKAYIQLSREQQTEW